MWQEFFDKAQHNWNQRRIDLVEGPALRALKFAKEEKNPIQIAKTYHLLGAFYTDTDNSLAADTLRQSIAASFDAYGLDCLEAAEDLDLLAFVLEHSGRFQESMIARMQAAKIFEKKASTERLMECLDLGLDNAAERMQLDEVEHYANRLIEVTEREFGVDSDEYRDEVARCENILDEIKEFVKLKEEGEELQPPWNPDIGGSIAKKLCSEVQQSK